MLSAISFSIAAIAWSQDEKEAGGHDLSVEKHVNLRVLPADISVPKLGRLMKGYKRDLGVDCDYCHVQNRDTGKFDYASDENPKKAIARVMIAMVDDINDNHLSKLGDDVRYSTPVTCGSCHRGRANPQPWEPAP